MHFNEFLINLGSACAIVILIKLTGSNSQADEYRDDEDEHRGWSLLLTAKKSAAPIRKLQCVAKAPHRRPLKRKITELKSMLMSTMYDDESKGESHTEICYRNEEARDEFDENPPTLDPNLLPPTAPEMKIKTNSSILVSWQAIKREKYPIDYFLVEFYQYNGTNFCSKCCAWVKNEIKNKTSDSYHEELIDGMEPNFDYKFRIASSYPINNQSWGPWGETIHLPIDFEGEDSFDHAGPYGVTTP